MRRLSLLAFVLATACAAPSPVEVGPLAWSDLTKVPYRGIEGDPHRQANLIEGLAAHGDLDGDGSREAVVLLESSGVGTGRFLYIAVVGRSGGEARNVATRFVGDRVQVRGLRIEGRQVVLDVVRAGTDDPACCPGELATLGWTLEKGTLQPAPRPEVPTRLTTEILGRGEWVLRKWNPGESAPSAPPITLSLREGRFVGHAGCNRYFTGVKAGALPGEIAVSPAGATRMACPLEIMNAESRFLASIGRVTRFGFHAGLLVLSSGEAGPSGTMFFSRR